jgi:hypothetical protein
MIDHKDIEPGYYWARYRHEYTVWGQKESRITEWSEPQIIKVENDRDDKEEWHVGTIDCDDGFHVKDFIFIKKIDTSNWEGS